jgi:hypothetical protein
MKFDKFVKYISKTKLKEIDISLLDKKEIDWILDNKTHFMVFYELWGKKYVLHCGEIKLYLIEWYPNSMTKLHGHTKEGCRYYSLQNGLLEKRVTSGGISINPVKPNKNHYIDDSIGYHIMKNSTDSNLYSIHIYGTGEYKIF